MKQNGVVCWPGHSLLFFIFRFEYLILGPKSFEKRAPGLTGLQQGEYRRMQKEQIWLTESGYFGYSY